MSLIRVRRNRKKNWIDARKGITARKLMVLLAAIVVAIWYLGTAF